MAKINGAALTKITAKEGVKFVKEFLAGGGLGAGAFVDGLEKLGAQGLEVAAFDAHQVDEAGPAVHLGAGEQGFKRVEEASLFAANVVHRAGVCVRFVASALSAESSLLEGSLLDGLSVWQVFLGIAGCWGEVEFAEEGLAFLGMGKEAGEMKGGFGILGVGGDVGLDWGGCVWVGEFGAIKDLEAELFGSGIPEEGGLDGFGGFERVGGFGDAGKGGFFALADGLPEAAGLNGELGSAAGAGLEIAKGVGMSLFE